MSLLKGGRKWWVGEFGWGVLLLEGWAVALLLRLVLPFPVARAGPGSRRGIRGWWIARG